MSMLMRPSERPREPLSFPVSEQLPIQRGRPVREPMRRQPITVGRGMVSSAHSKCQWAG